MPLPILFPETSLSGTLTGSTGNISSAGDTPTFTFIAVDSNTGAAYTPHSPTILWVGKGTASFEGFYGTVSTTSGVTTFTTIARGLPKVYSATPLTAVAANYQPHFAGDNVSCVDAATYLNILGLKLNGGDAMNNNFDMGTNKIVNLGTPTASTDAASKSYVDGVAIAGGANASSTVKGISKLSLDPVSLTNPIAVGDNDTRVPTAIIDTSAGVADAGKTVKTLGTGYVNDAIVTKLKDVTSTAAELNKLNTTSANVTATNLNTLTAGAASNADALHTHVKGTSYYISDIVNTAGQNVSGNQDIVFTTGFTAREIALKISLSINNATTNNRFTTGTLYFDGTTFKFFEGFDVTTSTALAGASTCLEAVNTFATSSTNAWSLTITVLSITATQVTFRFAYTKTGTPGDLNAFPISLIAYA